MSKQKTYYGFLYQYRNVLRVNRVEFEKNFNIIPKHHKLLKYSPHCCSAAPWHYPLKLMWDTLSSSNSSVSYNNDKVKKQEINQVSDYYSTLVYRSSFDTNEFNNSHPPTNGIGISYTFDAKYNQIDYFGN